MYKPARATTNESGADISGSLNSLVSSAIKSKSPWESIKRAMKKKSERTKIKDMRIVEMISSNRNGINLLGHMLRDAGIPKFARFTVYSVGKGSTLIVQGVNGECIDGKNTHGISKGGLLHSWRE